MIKLFRIDERLIHGQIAIKWSRHLNITHIVVANQAAANNVLIQKSLKMAAPAGVKVAIKGIEEAAALIHDPRSESLQMLVLVDSPEDALELVKNISGVDKINVGNYGRVAAEKPNQPRKSYALNIYCDESEVAAFKKLIATGISIYYQTIPEDTAVSLDVVFK